MPSPQTSALSAYSQGDVIRCHGIKCHLHTDTSQTCASNTAISPGPDQIHPSIHLLVIFNYISHCKPYVRSTEFLISPQEVLFTLFPQLRK